MSELPPWLTVGQAAELCGVERAEMYAKMLPTLTVRRIGVRNVFPTGRLIRIERASLLRLVGEPDLPSPPELARWVTIRAAAEHYQVSRHLIRVLIAHEELDARRIAGGKQIRIDRSSLLALGCYHHRGTW